MIHKTVIDSGMRAEEAALKRRPEGEVGFYLVASNRELLSHVEALMNRSGVFGVLDSSGRVHYLLDGRKGSPFAARKVMTTADQLIRQTKGDARSERRRIRAVVGKVLDGYGWNRQLRGFRLLAGILSLTACDPSLLNPVSKRLYPQMAHLHGLRPHQVERNVRYLFDDLAAREAVGTGGGPGRLLGEGENSLPVGRTIARLSEEVWKELEIFEGTGAEEED
ncbi:MAG: sporulation initiation factor Spo0A C-terminal domain-containing protein [Saccharofermentanales bacterium]